MPSTPAPRGWKWSALSDLARLESGHTPSRNHPEYWGGDVPWISISDARAHDGDRIDDTEEKTNELGLANSSARLLPSNTVCLSRTASVGYVVVMGRPMATSQDFVNWICSEELDYNFLKYLFIAEDEGLLRFASGSVHQTIYFPEVKAFHICHPPLAEQQRIVGVLDEAFASLATAQAHAAQNLQNARALFESCIQVEFGKDVALGELVDIKTGKLDANAAEEDGEYPFFTCSRETYAINNYAFDCEAVLLAGNNAVGDFNVKHYVGKFNAYQRTYVITINSRKRAISRYLYYQLQKNLAKFKSQSVGTGTKFLKLGMIKDMMIPLPTIPEQSRIVNQFDALAAETQRLAQIYEQKLAALAALKKSLLHQAFSGEL
jgi:type I restriction enzyme S subunit